MAEKTNKGGDTGAARTRARMGSRGVKGGKSVYGAFEILRVAPTRKGSAVRANAWVRLFDAVEVQFKVIDGPDGLWVNGPTGEYKDRSGRTRYVRRFRFVDEDLQDAVETAVLTAFQESRSNRGVSLPDRDGVLE